MSSSVHSLALPSPTGTRMPKLKYRTPLSAGEAPLPSPTLSVQTWPSTEHSDALSGLSTCSFDASSLSPPSFASSASSIASVDGAPVVKIKKKTQSVVNFFSLKEPSQAALHKFAEQERRQTALKRSSFSSGAMASPSGIYLGKQLPSDVPKVNSKWDGLPDVRAQRPSAPESSRQLSRGSFSFDSSASNNADARTKRGSTVSIKMDNSCVPAPLVKTAALSDLAPIADDNEEVGSVSPASCTGSADVVTKSNEVIMFNSIDYQSSMLQDGSYARAVQCLDMGLPVKISQSQLDSSEPSTTEDNTSTSLAQDYSRSLTIHIKVPDDDAQSFVPSVMSQQWHQSPLVRLGLGSRLRNKEEFSWDEQDISSSKLKKKRKPLFGMGTFKA